jgi:hypothetical protein
MTEPTAINLKTGQPLKITLSKGAGRKHGEAAGDSDSTARPASSSRGRRSSVHDDQAPGSDAALVGNTGEEGRTGRAGRAPRKRLDAQEITVPAPIQLARQLAPRSPKRQAGILLGYLIADAVAAALRGRA